MGRKIPGKKHKGVKDPLIQNAIKEEKLKMVINAPPSNPDHQEIPKSLENIIRLKRLAQNNSSVRKRKKRVRSKLIDTSRFMIKETKLPGMKKPDKNLPNLTQWMGETDEMFMKRVDEATQALINEVEFEEQFGVQVKRNLDTGDIEGVEAGEEDEIDLLLKKKKWEEIKGKGKKKKSKTNKDADFLNSKQRKKLKLLEKKRQRFTDMNEKDKYVDCIKFGEVVHRPPELTVRPKNVKPKLNHPGVKGNLLLQKILLRNDNSKLPNNSPRARMKQLELTNNVVELYRQLKRNKHNN